MHRDSALYDGRYYEGRSLDLRRRTMYQQEFARLLSKTGFAEGKVLDIGCGLGEFLDLFPDDRWQKYGIEASQYAIEACKRKGIAFELPPSGGVFDLIVMRGALQHLDRPMDTLFKSYDRLKEGGWLAVLATPNAGSVVYRLFQELPALDPPRNYVVFSNRVLRQCLINIGFRQISFEYPYLGTPYASPIRDHILFALRLLRIRRTFPFWGNMMECYACR